MTDGPPDIVLIIADQQRHDTIRAPGASHMDTPNLDRLARHGVAFEQCHVPSRAPLFSGYYPHTNGVLANGAPWSRTWVPSLADAGYHGVNIGKMHTIPSDAKAGLHERFVVENKDRFAEGCWFTDDWDKAILNAGHEKPGRLGYRAGEDYRHTLGAFEWEIEDRLHSDSFAGRLTE
ncbi:sulfatase-like hydrolase/transferase [Salipiger aestuarii]|uniref:sulfatase-like hydrolase/transferase n=1 Tax=Salipiger aestuarii TaxID=568098 RepID=UPI00123A3F8E|nr:sulfatase-like hydrolase/transferase [Salipiger aestuarii]